MAQYQMSDEDKSKLRTNRVYLLKNLVLTEQFVGYLIEKGVLTEDMKEEIEVEKVRNRKIAKLLDLLPRRGPKAFHHFIEALVFTNQNHIAESLDKSALEQLLKAKQTEPKPAHHHHTVTQQAAVPWEANKFNVASFSVEEESGFYNPEVKTIDVSDPYVIQLIKDTTQNYKMTSKPRGNAVIINNSYFVNNSPREGAAFDSQNICTHLEQLFFNTILHNDLTAEEMKNVIMEQSRRDHFGEDCFIMFILTHGSKGFVYGTDGGKLSIEEDIVAPFCGDRCKSLLNKPKIFFIQACQGEQATEGVELSEVDAVPIYELEEAVQSLNIKDDDKTMPHLDRTHEKSDVVLAYSTVPGYRSWRRTDLGSWFVRAIIKVFAAEAHKEDLLSLLVKVRETVAALQTNHGDHSYLQLTRTDETTRKKIYFFPGYYDKSQPSYV